MKKSWPHFIKATSFRAAAIQRLVDADCLYRAGRFQGAIYLCGYALECELKQCVCRSRGISRMGESKAKELGHNLSGILDQAGLAKLLSKKADIREAFQALNTRWSPELRYSGEPGDSKETERFLRRAKWVITWLRTASKES